MPDTKENSLGVKPICTSMQCSAKVNLLGHIMMHATRERLRQRQTILQVGKNFIVLILEAAATIKFGLLENRPNTPKNYSSNFSQHRAHSFHPDILEQ